MVLDPNTASSSESARTRANRENARKSTGPRTPEGKQRSSRNAVKHGIFCPGTVLPGESDQGYRALIASHYASFNPVTLMELSLVEQIADAQWRLARLRRTESNFLFVLGEKTQETTEKKLERLKQKYDHIDFTDRSHCTDEEDARVFNRVEILSTLLQLPVDASASLLHAVLNEDKALARMGLYEQRLQQTITRSLRQLKELRTCKAFAPTEELSPLVESLLPRNLPSLDPAVFETDDEPDDNTDDDSVDQPNDDPDCTESDEMPQNAPKVDGEVDQSKNEPNAKEPTSPQTTPTPVSKRSEDPDPGPDDPA